MSARTYCRYGRSYDGGWRIPLIGTASRPAKFLPRSLKSRDAGSGLAGER